MATASVNTATATKPGAWRSARVAWRTSVSVSPTSRVPRASRCCSRMRSALPKARSAARRASAAFIPRRTFSAVSISRWKRISSSYSRSTRPRRSAPRSQPRTAANAARGCMAASARGEDQLDRARVAAPVVGLGLERAGAQRGEAVVLRLAVVLGDAPLARDEAAVLEADEGGVDGALADVERVARELADALRDAPAVHGLE